MLAPNPTRSRATPALAAGLIAFAGAATLAGAWFMQLVMKLQPCPLCLEQRIPYYVAVPLASLLAIAALRKAPRAMLAIGFGLLAVLMLTGASLAVYHAGVEWHWWAGPSECTGPLNNFGGNILKELETFSIVRCDEAPWRFLGLSLAGYNVLISLALAGLAALGLAASLRYGSSSVSQ
jgi:disulfide bond formation protein DsbB